MGKRKRKSGVRLRGTEIRVSADRDGIVQNLGGEKGTYSPGIQIFLPFTSETPRTRYLMRYIYSKFLVQQFWLTMNPQAH
jgi:hypothetical protein